MEAMPARTHVPLPTVRNSFNSAAWPSVVCARMTCRECSSVAIASPRSMLRHDRPRKLRRIPVSGQLGQRRGYLGIAAIHRVQVPIRGGRGRMPEPPHQIIDRCARRTGLPGMTQVVEPESGPASLPSRPVERLAYRIAAHQSAITPDEQPIRTGQLAMRSTSTGSTYGGIVTVRLPAAVFGSASNTALVASTTPDCDEL